MPKRKPIKTIADLSLDPGNANRGTERGRALLDESLRELGAGRSIVADAKGRIIAGNKTLQAAQDAGIPIRIIETDGTELVVVQRTDLDLDAEDKKARRLAYADNRVGELDLAWDVEQISADIAAGLDLGDLWGDIELDELKKERNKEKGWNPEDKPADGIDEETGYSLSSLWYDLPRVNAASEYMLDLPSREGVGGGGILTGYSRTNATETERIIKTYMRPDDVFFEMCCGWMTFSCSAKYWGFSGCGADIWDKSIEFCKRQIKAMPGDGRVEVLRADCRDTGQEPGSYDFVHSNPPFFSLEKYSGEDNDLASCSGYDGWLQAMGEMGAEAERILKPGGLANFVINDYRKGGVVVPMHSDFIGAILATSSLLLHDLVVSEVKSQSIRFRKKNYERRCTVKCHEYVITFKKGKG